MRMRALFSAVVVAPALIVLASCGSAAPDSGDSGASGAGTSGSSTADSAGTSSSETGSESATSTKPPAGPEIPADTTVADPVPRDQMPTATGSFGEKPTITTPDSDPPDSLQRIILSPGDGPEVKAGDTVMVDYLGQVWGGEVFDNSYDRGQPYTTQIGGAQRQVVAGWDVGLRGVKQGSRVMLSFPPRDGYGSAGNPPDISGTDTLIFVIDVRGVYGPDIAGDPNAEPQNIPAGWPSVGGELGQIPTVAIPSSLPEPTEPGVTLVAKGSGAPAAGGTILVQYVASSWDGSHIEQSWPDPSGKNPLAGSGPQSFPLSESSPFAALLGVPIGSRVLMRTPSDPKTGVPPVAWVIDLIAQVSTSDASTSGASASATSDAGPTG